MSIQGAIAELSLQLGLVHFNLALELCKLLLFLSAQWRLLLGVLFGILLCAPWVLRSSSLRHLANPQAVLLLLELIHSRHHLHNLLVLLVNVCRSMQKGRSNGFATQSLQVQAVQHLRNLRLMISPAPWSVLVLLTPAHALLLQNGLSLDNGLLQVFQFLRFCWTEAGRFFLHLLLGLLSRSPTHDVQSLAEPSKSFSVLLRFVRLGLKLLSHLLLCLWYLSSLCDEVAKLGLKALHNLASVDIAP